MPSLLLLGTGLLLLAGFVMWIASARPPSLALNRFAAVMVGYAVLIVALGLWWLPPIGAVRQIERASAQIGASRAPLNCADAPGTMRMINDVSAGNVELRAAGELIVAGTVWTALSSDQRSALIDLLAQLRRCAQPSGPIAVRVLDRDTNQLLQTVKR